MPLASPILLLCESDESDNGRGGFGRSRFALTVVVCCCGCLIGVGLISAVGGLAWGGAMAPDDPLVPVFFAVLPLAVCVEFVLAVEVACAFVVVVVVPVVEEEAGGAGAARCGSGPGFVNSIGVRFATSIGLIVIAT